jgi:hypothetical protein
MQAQNSPIPTRPASESSPPVPAHPIVSNLRAAAAHAGMAKLLLRRAAADTLDPDQVRTLHDLAGILQHVIVEIDALARTAA